MVEALRFALNRYWYAIAEERRRQDLVARIRHSNSGPTESRRLRGVRLWTSSASMFCSENRTRRADVHVGIEQNQPRRL